MSARPRMMDWIEARTERRLPVNPPLWIAHAVKLAVSKEMGDCWRDVAHLPEQWSWAERRDAVLMFQFGAYRELAPFRDGAGLPIDFSGRA